MWRKEQGRDNFWGKREERTRVYDKVRECWWGKRGYYGGGGSMNKWFHYTHAIFGVTRYRHPIWMKSLQMIVVEVDPWAKWMFSPNENGFVTHRCLTIAVFLVDIITLDYLFNGTFNHSKAIYSLLLIVTTIAIHSLVALTPNLKSHGINKFEMVQKILDACLFTHHFIRFSCRAFYFFLCRSPFLS